MYCTCCKMPRFLQIVFCIVCLRFYAFFDEVFKEIELSLHFKTTNSDRRCTGSEPQFAATSALIKHHHPQNTPNEVSTFMCLLGAYILTHSTKNIIRYMCFWLCTGSFIL